MADEKLPPQASSDALAELLGMYRHQVTAFEANAWKAIMCAVSEETFMAYLQSHVFGGSAFAPKPSEATRALGLILDPESAYAYVERLVRELGPYVEPAISDPVLVQTILYMGGWVTLNEQMPDPTNGFAVKNFRDRFDACFNQASNAVRIRGDLPSRPLLALSSPRPIPAAALPLAPTAKLTQSDPRRNAAASRHQRYGQSPQ